MDTDKEMRKKIDKRSKKLDRNIFVNFMVDFGHLTSASAYSQFRKRDINNSSRA